MNGPGMLSDLKRYLSERPLASVADIALHLEVAPDVARAMLQPWIRKGRVQRLEGAEGCAGCHLCQPGGRELYRWVSDGVSEADASMAQHRRCGS